MNKESLGDKIRTLRQEKNMSQEEMSFLCEISQGYLCKIENGKNNNPSAKKISDIANVLAVPVTYLM